MAIEYRLLGSLEALERGRPLALGAPRQRAVLAWLLLHANEVVLVSRLIDELWREEPPETAANILQGYVSDLRKVLGREAIETVGHGYMIHVDASDIDLRRFEALADEGIEALEEDRPRQAAEILRRGLELWHGPPLADLQDEPLAAVAVNRLEELRLTALEKRIDADLASGQHTQIVAELASLVDEYPLRERFRAQLMLALYRSGRQADALASYQAGRAILTEELGIDPGPALQSLEQAILEQDRSLDLVDGDEEALRDLEASRRVVLAVAAGASDPSSVLDLGEALVRKPVFELIVAGLVADSAELASRTAMLNERAGELAQRGVVARAAAFVSDRPGEDVVRLASDRDVVLVLIQAPAILLDKGMPDPDLAHILAEAPCDVAFVVARDHSSGGPIVVPFGGMDHDWAAIELGAWVARARGVPLQIVGAVGSLESGKRDASRLLFHASVAVQRAVGIPTEPLLADPGVEGMLSASERGGALVVGLSERWQREGLGPVRLALARNASAPVLFVRSGLRPGGLAPRETLTHFTWSVGPIVA